MGVQNSSGLTSVTGNVSVAAQTSLPQKSSIQAPFNYYQGNKGAGDVTLGTVPASKVWYIMGINAMCPAATTNMAVQKDATVLFYLGVAVAYNSVGTNGTSPIGILTAGQALKLVGGTGMYVNVWGYETDA